MRRRSRISRTFIAVAELALLLVILAVAYTLTRGGGR
jgi:hypothetical protein